ncbi:MAG: DUF502 domain-containing protein [Acidobacteriota bacterium]|nr:DUF502 domain-containing protein [Acidobacteriota bacterium]
MIRRYLLAGLFTLLPMVVTIWILRWIFDALIGIFRSPLVLVYSALSLPEPGYWTLAFFSAIATIILLMLVGASVGNFVGKQLLLWMDELMLHVPVVKGVYGATKQLINAIQSGQGQTGGGGFKEVVLVEWPHPGSYTLGFVAHRDCSWAMEGGERMIAVYIATAPNPTSGYVVMVDVSKVRPVSLRPDQALTWAVSGGVIIPASVKLPENGNP